MGPSRPMSRLPGGALAGRGRRSAVGPGTAQLILDAVQQQVAMARRAVLLLGPAGTGKSVALQEATAQLALERGPHGVVAVAADRATARSWQSQMARSVPGAAPVVTTVAGLAQQVLDGSAQWGRSAVRGGASARTDGLGGDLGDDGHPTVRTLTAPEQEMRIREILLGTVESGSVEWPAEWKPALGTRTFARQLRRAVAHARRTGWEPADLCREANGSGDRGWVAVGQFLAEYLEVLDWEGAVDYSELALRALRLCESRPAGSGAGLVVVVDDAHHLDLTQQRFLHEVAATGYVIAAGDPDQCVASYKGADLSALAALAADAEVITTQTVYRGGSRQRDARQQLMANRWYSGLPTGSARQYRAPAVFSDVDDHIEVIEYDDPVSQSRHVAEQLRRAHRAGMAWRDMAVLAVSPASDIPGLARGLGQARIPVHVPASDVAVAEQPAVATLLAAARLVLADDPAAACHDTTWRELLVSDLGAVPPRRVRELTRRVARRLAAGEGSSAGRGVADSAGADSAPTPPTLAELGRDPALTQDLPQQLGDVVRAIGSLDRRITAARRLQQRNATPAEVLWELWQGSEGDSWPQRLRRRSLATGESAIAAGRDLDAVIQVFRLAERAPERWGGHRGLESLVDELEHQEIPAEPDLKQESHTDSVAVLSLHRALGRSWPLVVVTGMHESNWQASDGGDGLIQPHRLTASELLAVTPRRAAAEQRRLFNAVLARSTHRLVLTACGGPDDPPTALLDDAGLKARRIRGVPDAPQTPIEVLLRARRTAATDEARAPGVAAGAPEGAPRGEAVRAVAALVGATRPDGRPMFPGMAPARWQGASEWTVGPVPMRPADRPLSLSGSAVSLLDQCQLRWVLQRELKGDRPRGTASEFGLAVHAAAAALVGGADERQPEEILAQMWGQVSYDADWHARQEHAVALEAVERARQWLVSRPVPVIAEQHIDVLLLVPAEEGAEAGAVIDRIRVTGSADVVEPHDDHVLVWDYKTQRSPSSQADAAGNVQLAVYQLAVAEMLGLPARGAGLVHVCVPAGTNDPMQPKLRQQPPIGEQRAWADHVLRDAAAAVRTEQFQPVPGVACRTCPFQDSCPAQTGRGAL